ncbi:hypothetical protein VUR80DRAFT_6535 [Thermomyces stellatus]
MRTEVTSALRRKGKFGVESTAARIYLFAQRFRIAGLGAGSHATLPTGVSGQRPGRECRNGQESTALGPQPLVEAWREQRGTAPGRCRALRVGPSPHANPHPGPPCGVEFASSPRYGVLAAVEGPPRFAVISYTLSPGTPDSLACWTKPLRVGGVRKRRKIGRNRRVFTPEDRLN